MRFINALSILLLFLIINISHLNGNQLKKMWQQDLLTGDWSGLRSSLEKKGISLEVLYTGEMASIRSGGIQKKTIFLDNKDIVLSLDADKLFRWKGAKFSLYILGNGGGSPTEYIGDTQVYSNIDTYSTWKMYEVWYQQNFLMNKLSFRIGLYDLNSEFDVIEAAGVFHNSSFGIGPDFSQSGVNGPSIFATTSLGLRVQYRPIERLYIQGVVLDGVPGNPDNPRGTHIILKKDDGVLLASEIGYISIDKSYSKIALGAWYYSSPTQKIMSNNPLDTRKNFGIYGLFEIQLLSEKEVATQGLTGFLRIGTADKYINQIDFFLGVGLVYTGLIPGRDNDQIAIGLAYAHNGAHFIESKKFKIEKAEAVFEFVYHFQATPWFVIKPEFQYIINPGTIQELNNAFVIGIRTEISF